VSMLPKAPRPERGAASAGPALFALNAPVGDCPF
jgi:hypothetical protein